MKGRQCETIDHASFDIYKQNIEIDTFLDAILSNNDNNDNIDKESSNAMELIYSTKKLLYITWFIIINMEIY